MMLPIVAAVVTLRSSAVSEILYALTILNSILAAFKAKKIVSTANIQIFIFGTTTSNQNLG
jgi:hypothetical protein